MLQRWKRWLGTVWHVFAKKNERAFKTSGLAHLWVESKNEQKQIKNITLYIYLKKSNQDGALAMLDIDHFKSINDTYGHDSGDEVLKGLAVCFKKYFEKQLVARLGGEEFAVYFTDATTAQALKRLEGFRQFIELNSQEFSQEKIKFTISIGFASGPIYQIDELLKQADLKLYDAKETGRNKVIS